ncbi:hypothetical protein [Hansschlegelia plantiphila]|nr:hypothetical protein [Hansschlegelia plantiphila]
MRKPLILTSMLLATCVTGAGFAIAGDQPPPPPMEHGGASGPQGWGGPDGPRRGPGGDRRGGPMKLAARLSAMETLIGIRADQLDAWRAFTSAAVDLVTPPARPEPMKDGADGQPKPREAFDLADRMADRAIARGEKAKALKEAVAALRQKLTPEQLERVKLVEREMRGHFHRGPGGGFGPGGPGMRGPHHGPDAPR